MKECVPIEIHFEPSHSVLTTIRPHPLNNVDSATCENKQKQNKDLQPTLPSYLEVLEASLQVFLFQLEWIIPLHPPLRLPQPGEEVLEGSMEGLSATKCTWTHMTLLGYEYRGQNWIRCTYRMI